MNNQIIKGIFGLVIIGLSIGPAPMTAQTSSKGERVGETVKVQNENIEWEAFDTTSSIAKTDIKNQNLQGLWNAYKGVYRFGDYVNAMELTKPFILEVKGDTFRRNSDGAFEKYILKDNLVIQTRDSKIDTGIINRITATELTISWKDKSNYTRYFYKK